MRLLHWLAGLSAAGLAACAAPSGPGPAAAPSLAGTRWIGVVAQETDRRHVPRLEFVQPGRVNGFTGCNMLSGSWSDEGGTVRLGPMITTKRMCVGPEMDIERRLLESLGEKTRVTQEGGKLVFTSESGKFEFVPAPPGY